MKSGQTAALALLLLCAALPNYSYDALALIFGSTGPRWQYVMEGVAGVVLFGFVSMLSRHWLWILACAWGALESLLKGACGAFRLFDAEFAPGGYVCSNGEAWSLVLAYLGGLLALAILRAK